MIWESLVGRIRPAHHADMALATRQRVLAFSTTVLFGAGVGSMTSPWALAAAGCTSTTPNAGDTVVCSSSGTDTITIPSGVSEIVVTVIGGGGGGGAGISTGVGGDGGGAASVAGTLSIPTGSTALSVVVGAGGSGGLTVSNGFSPTAAGGGGGGGLSSVSAGGMNLVIAGGGGGGGGQGIDRFSARGGAGAGTGISGGSSGNANAPFYGGSGGASGSGGAGGLVVIPTGEEEDGGDDGTSTTGGDGGTVGGIMVGGQGGDGYGGGGGGAAGVHTSNADDGFIGAGGGAGGSFANSTYLRGSATYATASSGGAGDRGLGGSGGSPIGGSGSTGSITITFVLDPSTLSSASSSSALVARSVALNLTLPTGMTCDFGSITASDGAWVRLPSASDCTNGDARSGSTLLGWATAKGFPVEIAQRQVEKGWGVYELTDDDGSITAVFIPAGGMTLLSNDTSLYPIWA